MSRPPAALIPGANATHHPGNFRRDRDKPARSVGTVRLEEKTMFGRGKAVRNLEADEVAHGMRQNRILLVDVREPNETALRGFPCAALGPLSSFDPACIPGPGGREG